MIYFLLTEYCNSFLGTSSIKGKIMIIGGLFHRLCVYSIKISDSIVGKPKHIFDLLSRMLLMEYKC